MPPAPSDPSSPEKPDRPAPPVLFDDPAECCGCAACRTVCPVLAISMKPDAEGFLYPQIDAKRCIRCHRCLDACAFKMALRSRNGRTTD